MKPRESMIDILVRVTGLEPDASEYIQETIASYFRNENAARGLAARPTVSIPRSILSRVSWSKPADRTRHLALGRCGQIEVIVTSSRGTKSFSAPIHIPGERHV
jgi:hypothetical protein